MQTTTNTARKPQWADLLAAIETFTAAAVTRTQQHRPPAKLDLADLAEQLRAVAHAWRPGSADAGIAAVEAAAHQHATNVAAAGAVFGPMSSMHAEISVREAAKVLHLGAVDFGRDAELDAARSAEASAQHDLESAQAAIEIALEGTDVQEVLRLRQAIEVELPNKVAERHLTVLELVAERRKAEADVPRELHRVARDRLRDADTAVEEAKNKLAAAQASHAEAFLAAQTIAATAAAAEQLATAAATAATDYNLQMRAERKERLHRLAGLARTSTSADSQAAKPQTAPLQDMRIRDDIKQVAVEEAKKEPQRVGYISGPTINWG